jgi:hypothetical protein
MESDREENKTTIPSKAPPQTKPSETVPRGKNPITFQELLTMAKADHRAGLRERQSSGFRA